MAYCLEKDVPTFAVCRGEQVMSIVSGCTFIQDIPNYYKEQGATYNELAQNARPTRLTAPMPATM